MTHQDAAELLKQYMRFRQGKVWVLQDHMLVNEALQMAINALDEEPETQVDAAHGAPEGFWM